MQVKDKSHFIFIAISSSSTESADDKERFIKDVFHCVYVLQKIGVNGANISIVSDWDPTEWNSNGFNALNPIPPRELYSIIQSIANENLFIITCCHGGLNGIGGPSSIRPNDFISSIKQNEHVQNCLVFFGQCYAGVFNYTNVNDENKRIVYIGATGMRSGISSNTKWDISPTQSLQWIANISVFYMFEWLEHPIDVDNDGNYSIMDLYKYVSYQTNRKTEYIEKEQTNSFIKTQIELEWLKIRTKNSATLLPKLDADANLAKSRYLIPHQDCWILNAIPASSMHFEF